MTTSVSVGAQGVRRTVRRIYRKPPIHEVVLSLAFGSQVEPSRIESVAASLSARLPHKESLNQVQLEMSVAPGGSPAVRTTREDDGWQFKNDGPTRVVRASRQQLNIHAVRPDAWPTGEYDGWDAIYAESVDLLGQFATAYGEAKIERAGLRYLNRIAVPVGSSLEQWFTVGFAAPSFLADPFSMNLRQTWARVEGYDDFGATLGLAIIQIPEPTLQSGHIGILLDIEVFNPWKNKAPEFPQLAEWCRRAHDLEGDVFESCITEDIRKSFEEIK